MSVRIFSGGESKEVTKHGGKGRFLICQGAKDRMDNKKERLGFALNGSLIPAAKKEKGRLQQEAAKGERGQQSGRIKSVGRETWRPYSYSEEELAFPTQGHLDLGGGKEKGETWGLFDLTAWINRAKGDRIAFSNRRKKR